MSHPSPDPENAVKDRYSAASKSQEPALCCPVTYDSNLLQVIPAEVIERDYGCGDPSPYVRPGDVVVDLGSGGGKLCFIISQLVGASGRVIGVDFNSDMLALARQHQSTVAAQIGYDNIEFRCGRIQDLAIDLEALAEELGKMQIQSPEDAARLLDLQRTIRRERPMIPNNSVDCVVSNCVLNLVRREDREQLFAEIFRVLKPGGRAAISDIVSDEDVPEEMQKDPELWSGCISGAWREDRFLESFRDAGLVGGVLDKWEARPWRVVRGIEFRSVTVVATKPYEGACLERNQAVVYRGPFERVEMEGGYQFARGERMAVCDRTFRFLQQEPYRNSFIPIEPRQAIPLDAAENFNCELNVRRDPRETKRGSLPLTTAPADCCGGSDCC